jgi:hypothetical protein
MDSNIMAADMSAEGGRREVGIVRMVLFFIDITRDGRPTFPIAESIYTSRCQRWPAKSSRKDRRRAKGCLGNLININRPRPYNKERFGTDKFKRFIAKTGLFRTIQYLRTRDEVKIK